MSENIYPELVKYNELISPKTSYSCRLITKQNIKRFGFNSLDELRLEYPNFPNICQGFKDERQRNSKTLQNINQQKKFSKEQIYDQNPKKCINCSIPISYKFKMNKFCSSSCSAKYNNTRRSIETIEKQKQTLNKYISRMKEEGIPFNSKLAVSNVKEKNIEKYSLNPKKCSQCNYPLPYDKRGRHTCSNKCTTLLRAINAAKQQKYRRGYKGTYNGFRCDSSYELAFLIWHLDHGINIERCTEYRRYNYKNKERIYLPDFIIDNIIYEIKGFMDKKSISKLQDNPDIVCIDKNEIKKYIKYVIRIKYK